MTAEADRRASRAWWSCRRHSAPAARPSRPPLRAGTRRAPLRPHRTTARGRGGPPPPTHPCWAGRYQNPTRPEIAAPGGVLERPVATPAERVLRRPYTVCKVRPGDVVRADAVPAG